MQAAAYARMVGGMGTFQTGFLYFDAPFCLSFSYYLFGNAKASLSITTTREG